MRRKCTSLRIQPLVRSSRKFSLGKIITQWWKTCTVVNLYFHSEESKTEGWPLWKNDESPLRYYNITPTFILEVKLRVSTSHTHNVFFLTYSAFFFLSGSTNFVSLSLSRTCSHAHSLTFLSRLARLFLQRLLREKQPNRPPLAESSLSGSFLRARTPVLASRDQTLSVVGSETRETVALHTAKWKSVGFVGSYVTRSKIAKYFAELCVGNFLCNFTMKQSRARITLSADRMPQCAITFL